MSLKDKVSRRPPASEGIDRDDPETAGSVIETLVPDRTARHAMIQILADGIRLAHAVEPGAWELTLKSDGFTYNVGKARVLFYERGKVGLAIDADRVSMAIGDALRDVVAPGKVKMAHLNNHLDLLVPPENLPGLIRRVGFVEGLDAHRALIREAYAKARRSNWPRCHSPALVLYASEVLGTAVNPWDRTVGKVTP